jgi:hypothetical protein
MFRGWQIGLGEVAGDAMSRTIAISSSMRAARYRATGRPSKQPDTQVQLP